MPNLSNRGQEMPESPIRKLVPYAEAAKKKGRTVYHLNIGQPDIETPKVALDAVKNIDLNVIEYSHSAGIESYRKGLADYYNSGEQTSGYYVDFDKSTDTNLVLEGYKACPDCGMSESFLECKKVKNKTATHKCQNCNYEGIADNDE